MMSLLGVHMSTGSSLVTRWLAAGPGSVIACNAAHIVFLAGCIVGLSVPAAWITWRALRRTQRRVELVRVRLAEIGGSDLSLRVPEQVGGGEIPKLVRSVNRLLDRLERSTQRQRQFACDMAHELRTPLAALRLTLEEMILHPGEVDPAAGVQAALHATDRLESVMDDLLMLARLGTGTAVQARIDLADLTLAAVNAHRDHASRPVVRLNGVSTRGLDVIGVAPQLLRLIADLMGHACQRSHPIQVEIQRDGTEAKVTVVDDGAVVVVKDPDKGVGQFARRDRARRRANGWAGMGLVVAREIAIAHGGSLQIEDSDCGARSALRLPLA